MSNDQINELGREVTCTLWIYFECKYYTIFKFDNTSEISVYCVALDGLSYL